jgi:hypothetical protein
MIPPKPSDALLGAARTFIRYRNPSSRLLWEQENHGTTEPIGHLVKTFEPLPRLDTMASHDIYFQARKFTSEIGRQ